MTEALKLPVGIENFAEIRQAGFYYVDKTKFIEQLLDGWGKVNLFTRPRRFGKTLNMSMLRYFFEIGADASLFDGLQIAKNKKLCEEYQGKYPVIFLSFKNVEGLTFADAQYRLAELIAGEAERFAFLAQSDKLTENERSLYCGLTAVREGRYALADEVLVSALQLLSKLLSKHYGKKTIILLDEYDVPLDKAFQNGYYKEMVSLIRGMLGQALKTNEFLQFAVLTGCLRVSKESIFTGLNNFKVLSITDNRFDEQFGFTDAEVEQLLAAYNLADHLDETKAWYDGYRFGAADVYCPWDVINYCYALRASESAQPKAYWINTSGNDMVRKLIGKAADGTTQMEIERLIAGETIVKTLNENLTHNEVDANVENIWSLLYMTGYLTGTFDPSSNRYRLKIPNREIRQIYIQQVLEWFKEKAAAETEKLSVLYTAFESGDTETITDYLNEQLLDTVSFYDAQESFYHGFLLALLNTCANWRVSSNMETGKGRSDILVERKDRKIGFVIEVKDVKDEKRLDTACATALKQIEDKNYIAVLNRYRVKEIWIYGIAFCDKECRVVAKRMG